MGPDDGVLRKAIDGALRDMLAARISIPPEAETDITAALLSVLGLTAGPTSEPGPGGGEPEEETPRPGGGEPGAMDHCQAKKTENEAEPSKMLILRQLRRLRGAQSLPALLLVKPRPLGGPRRP